VQVPEPPIWCAIGAQIGVRRRFMQQSLQAHDRPSARFFPVDTRDVHEAGALGFMPRMFVLATLPHSQPKADRFERMNGRYSLRLEARRSIGLPYGVGCQ